jgi:hypothetical protein
MGFTAAAGLPGSKIGTFASLVPMKEAQLEQSLEDITGPIDPQQVHKPPAPRTTLSPASNHFGLGSSSGLYSGQIARGETSRLRAIFVEMVSHILLHDPCHEGESAC